MPFVFIKLETQYPKEKKSELVLELSKTISQITGRAREEVLITIEEIQDEGLGRGEELLNENKD